MQTTIRFSGGTRTDFGNHEYEQILHSSLERFQHQLKHVFLYLEDVNGPRGGVDKQCRCVLHLKRLPPIVIQDEDESVGALIHRVANRAAYALSQKADKKKKRSKAAASRNRFELGELEDVQVLEDGQEVPLGFNN